MRKTHLLLIALCLLLTACKKDNVSEWSRFYGFTADDIKGHYNANPNESLYEDQSSSIIVFYRNTSIDISASGSTVTMRIVIPGASPAPSTSTTITVMILSSTTVITTKMSCFPSIKTKTVQQDYTDG